MKRVQAEVPAAGGAVALEDDISAGFCDEKSKVMAPPVAIAIVAYCHCLVVKQVFSQELENGHEVTWCLVS